MSPSIKESRAEQSQQTIAAGEYSKSSKKPKSRFPKVEGLNLKQIKEYSLLGEVGLDDLIPKAFVHHFIRRDESGNHEMPVVYKDHINAHGFGKEYVNELRAKKGYTFAKQLKEPMHKSKYV